jgi:hypothetical protein
MRDAAASKQSPVVGGPFHDWLFQRMLYSFDWLWCIKHEIEMSHCNGNGFDAQSLVGQPTESKLGRPIIALENSRLGTFMHGKEILGAWRKQLTTTCQKSVQPLQWRDFTCKKNHAWGSSVLDGKMLLSQT